MESLPSALRWRADWWDVLAARDRISCQQSGPHGPPFVPSLKTARTFSRWLPWNWYSLDGTGWCYDLAWDEMRPCTEVAGSIDWNGVGNFPMVDGNPEAPLDLLQLLAVCFVALAVAGCFAHARWAARRARRAAHDAEKADGEGNAAHAEAHDAGISSLRSWVRSGRAAPWRWDIAAINVLIGGALGILAALSVPLPRLLPIAWMEAFAGDEDDAY